MSLSAVIPSFGTHLSVEALACARGDLRLFEGLSFHLKPGAVLAVRGPNGTGKTTLLRILAGFAPPVAGRILCGSAATQTADVQERREAVAYLGHADGLKPTMTPRETLHFWAKLFGTDDRGVLDAVNLTTRADLAARSLSAGQRKRLALARLLVSRRPVWLLDEPAVSLDDASILLLERLIEDHRTAGGIAIVALHGALTLKDAMICKIGGEGAS